MSHISKIQEILVQYQVTALNSKERIKSAELASYVEKISESFGLSKKSPVFQLLELAEQNRSSALSEKLVEWIETANIVDNISIGKLMETMRDPNYDFDV